jgi:parallel beta-helix repeat protein
MNMVVAVLALTILTAGANAMPQADFFVSTKGNDAWSGRLAQPNEMRTDGPFASITRAQQAVRKVKSPGTVFVRKGTYQLAKPLVFTPEDSGDTYAAYSGEKPIISGGKRITGWKKNGEFWTANIPAGWYFSDLYVNGERRFRPRLPKEGFFHIAEVISPDVKNAFRYAEGDIKPWQNMEDVEVIVFNAWDELRFHIAKLDTDTRTVTFTGSNNWPFGAWGQNNTRYYIENVREALTQPGEWYLDRKTGVLTYFPMAGEDMKKAEVIAPVLNQLLFIHGDKQQSVEHINFKGLSFRYAGWELPKESYISIQAAVKIPGVIHVQDAKDCSIEDCDISRVGQYGIDIASGSNMTIKGNVIHDMGAGGIKLGAGDHNLITRNHIYDLGHTYLSAVGIWIGNSGHNTVSYNHIHDLNYTGISVGWSWGYHDTLTQENIIEHNHIHDLGKGLLSDMGGIYTLGTSTGTVLRYNLIHDVVSYSYGGWGIYFDEGSTGIVAENNIVYRCKSAGFHQHYGKENIVRNNIFAFGTDGQIQRSRPEEHLQFTFEGNIVYYTQGNLLAGNWSGATSYRIDNNIYWDTRGPVKFPDDWKTRGMDANSIVADPLFVNPEKGDFRLKPSSPALKMGFKPIEGAGD